MIDFNSTTPKGGKYTKTQVWCTPPYIIEKLGGKHIFDLDPCQSDNIITETALNYFFEKDDGLNQHWFGNIYCNPPYNDLGRWLDKMSLHNNGIVLCFLRSDTKAFQNHVKFATGINMIKGRIKFINENGDCDKPANAASCLIAWGEHNYQRIKNIDGLYCRMDNLSI